MHASHYNRAQSIAFSRTGIPCAKRCRLARLSSSSSSPAARGVGRAGIRCRCLRSPYAFSVKAGSSLRSVARELAAAGIIPSEWALVGAARLARADRAIKAGNYELTSGATLEPAARQAHAGRRYADRLHHRRGLECGRSALGAARQAGHQGDPRRRRQRADDDPTSARPSAKPRDGSFPTPTSSRRVSSDVSLLARANRLMRARLRCGVGSARARAAARLGLPGADTGVDRREGNRARRRPAADRRGVHQPAATGHAPADRSHGDLRARRALRWAPASPRSRYRPRVQHLHARWPAADADLAPRARRRSTRCCIRRPSPFLYFVSRGDGSSEFSITLADHDRAVTRYQERAR